MSDTLKVVIDTQVFLRAFSRVGSSSYKALIVWSESYDLYTTNLIESEVVDVFTRPKVRAKFPSINDEALEQLNELFTTRAIRLPIANEDILPVCRDPKDDVFLACAKAAKADYLVSENNDLLEIGDYAGAKIVNVAQFLTILETRKSS